jgi:hypothetical protein
MSDDFDRSGVHGEKEKKQRFHVRKGDSRKRAQRSQNSDSVLLRSLRSFTAIPITPVPAA